MCSRIKQSRWPRQPGDLVTFTPAGTRVALTARWGCERGQIGMPPFARSETLQSKWLSRGWQLGSLHTEGIAERADTGELRWSSKSVDIQVVYLEVIPGDRQLAVVTKQATPREHKFFGHGRTPVVAQGIRSVTA